MTDRIDALPDHVAVAVPDPRATHAYWGERLGAGTVTIFGNALFVGRQYRFGNDAKVELVSPNPFQPRATFLDDFLHRFGTRIHHVTLKTPDIVTAIRTVEDAGYDVVDAQVESRTWKEAFLRPSQVGGMVVQLAQAAWNDREWAEKVGVTPTDPSPEAPDLLGPRLTHPDLAAAARLWSVLGADVERDGDRLRCRWDGAPLEVCIDEAVDAGPVALRMTGTGPSPGEDGLAPAIEPA